MIIQRVTVLCTLLLVPTFTFAQTPVEVPDDDQGQPTTVSDAAPADGRLRVYLDCDGGQGSCFPQYLRDEITFVDFVRQPQDADVHLLSSGQQTGSGGREVILRFVGRGAFEGHDHDLRVVTDVGDTENTRRDAVLRTVLVGLLDYVAHEGIPEGLELSVETEEAERVVAVPNDPWNLWVFSTRLNGSYNEDERSSEKQWSVNVSGDRVTEAWKISFGARVDRSTETFTLSDGDVEVDRNTSRIDGFLARSLGPHWSVGLRGDYSTSTFSNTEKSAGIRPAVEFSVFPYRDYATRELRIQYDVGPEYTQYNEVTIYHKLKETIWQQTVDANLDQRQPWGSLRASFNFRQYLHDTSLYRISGSGNISYRVTRGLSLNANGSASKIRDQVNLPLRDATDEEVLLRIRQLQSGYDVRFSFGVTYTFGSLFNNVVNPRFGGGGGF